jgi:pterin-4a-carbinolamine dehydratase
MSSLTKGFSLSKLQTLEQSCGAILSCQELETLQQDEVILLFSQLPTYWQITQDGWLACTVDNVSFDTPADESFYDFLFTLFCQIQNMAVKLNHHPRMTLAFSFLEVRIKTHATQPSSLTVNDFIFANQVSILFDEYISK